MDIEKKIREDMRKLGCTSEMNITLAYHLYIYLVDHKLMYDTEYCYNNDINVLYVVARPGKEEKLNIYVPIPTKQDLALEDIGTLQENLCTVETGPTVNLAFIESDFTIVIYTFTKELVDRLSPDAKMFIKQDHEKRRFINAELRRQRAQIWNDAMNGGAVDEEDCQVVS